MREYPDFVPMHRWIPVATAFVVGPAIEGGKIMSPHFDRIYQSIDRPFKTFATMEEA